MLRAAADSIRHYINKGIVMSPVLLLALILGLFLVVIPIPAAAGIAGFFAGVILWFAQFFGKLALTFIGLLVEVAQYNDFINAPAVQKGWVVMRDVVNMFFIVILLALAFGTVFRVEHYQYKHTLSKVLIMAVLVNFSKSIAGFIIDVSQVVMLTFVNGFKEAAAGNFVNGFGLDKMFQFAENNSPEAIADEGAFFYAALLALIALAITCVVVGVYLIIFMLRIAVLWLLVITSPIAFLASAFPGESHLKQEAAKWWDYFGRYVTTGPLLAFFLWLSLAVMQFGSSALGDFVVKGGFDKSVPAAAVTAIGGSEVLLSFMINIVLLLGGLYFASQLGVAGGSLAGAALQGMQKISTSPLRGAGWAAKNAGKWGLKRLDDAQAGLQKRFMQSGLGQKLAKSKLGQGLGLGKIAEHGIQLRTLPHAWEERSKRKERERLGSSAGVAEDIMSRTLSLGNDKTNKSSEQNAKLATEASAEVIAVSTDWENLANEIEDCLNDKGEVRGGREHLFEGLMVQLSKTHDPNEIMKNSKMGRKYGLTYTSESIKKFLIDALGKGKATEQVARVGFRMQEAGLTNTDGLIKGTFRMKHGHFDMPDYFAERVEAAQSSDPSLTKVQAEESVVKKKRTALEEVKQNEIALRDTDKGGYGKAYKDLNAEQKSKVSSAAHAEVEAIPLAAIQNMVQREDQGKVAAAFIAKRTFRNISNQARFQDFFAEVADQFGNRYAGALTDVGRANIRLNGGAMAQQYNAMNEETKKYLGRSIDLFVKDFDENIDTMKPEEIENSLMFISAIVTGKQVISDENIISTDDIKKYIEKYTPTRNDDVKLINQNRRDAGILDVYGVELKDDAPVYNVKRDDKYPTPKSHSQKRQQSQNEGGPATSAPPTSKIEIISPYAPIPPKSQRVA
ncbi:MAG: hypothetical protein HY973_00830 [Candidatus Kerfeldbacteria bacterium]|nr:hypothetical protein [Candidatus Kerfeldbacteria bacterium]